MSSFNKEKTLLNPTLKQYGFLMLVVLSCIPKAAAQSSNFPGGSDNNSRFQTPSVSPGMAIIIVVLIAALFCVAFFSIYIRNRSSTTGNTIRQTLSMRRRTAAPTRGLDASFIEANFPTFSYAEVKDDHIGKGALECAVCLNEFEDAEMLRLIPLCDHVFHPECIDAWLKSHVTCPVCRTDLSTTTTTPHVPDQPLQVQDQQTVENSQQNDNHISIRIESDEKLTPQDQGTDVAVSSRPPRSFSIKMPRMFSSSSKFRSHSTGHSLVVPGENLDRYTLRLPENVRKEVMNRALLNRTKSCAVALPRYDSTRRGYRTGIERSDLLETAKSDRWVFKIAPPFFTRGASIKSPKDGEGSTSRSVKMGVKMPSFRCLEPKNDDEPGLLTRDSARSSV